VALSGGALTVTLGGGRDTLVLYDTATHTVTDFAAGPDGDRLDISNLVTALVGYDGGNPFGTGYLRLVQDGADTLLDIDLDADGTAFTTILRLQNTTATDIVADNFTPAFPPDGSSPAGETITGTPGDDVLEGTVGDDIIDGLAGNDTIHGLGGHDTIYGGEG